MTRTPLGRSLYAVGVNPTAAVYAGIDVGRTKFIAFCISGLVAGLSGYLWVSRYVIASVEVANGYELNVIAACVIGGISIAGGIGSVGGAVLGALFLGIINNALPVVNISPFWQMAISGSAIILAVVLNARGERSQGRIILRKAEARMSATEQAAGRAAIPDRLDTPLGVGAAGAGRRCWSPSRSRSSSSTASPRPISSTRGRCPTSPSISPRRR